MICAPPISICLFNPDLAMEEGSDPHPLTDDSLLH